MVSFSVELTGAESVGGVSLCRTHRSRIGGCVLIQRSETFTEVLGVYIRGLSYHIPKCEVYNRCKGWNQKFILPNQESLLKYHGHNLYKKQAKVQQCLAQLLSHSLACACACACVYACACGYICACACECTCACQFLSF